MPIASVVDPVMTRDERRSAMLDATRAAIKDGPGSAALDLYERSCSYYGLLADREEAAARLREVDAALQAAHAQHVTDVNTARMLDDATHVHPLELPQSFDPAALRERASMFAGLAKACRSRR